MPLDQKYGIDLSRQRRPRRDDHSLVVPICVVLAVLALIWFILARIARARQQEVAAQCVAKTEAETRTEEAALEAQTSLHHTPVHSPSPTSYIAPTQATKPELGQEKKRPAKVRNLLDRLAQAERLGKLEMALSTLEQLRALPGAPVADLDEVLVHRIGVLNLQRLFNHPNEWVSEVTIRRGDVASRLAREHGSTLASLAKLNGGNLNRLIIGQKLKILDHPRFILTIHALTQKADLALNGKFFKRYTLLREVPASEGVSTLDERLTTFFKAKGLFFTPADCDELELLLPLGTTIKIERKQ